jgi:hypothetical protein
MVLNEIDIPRDGRHHARQSCRHCLNKCSRKPFGPTRQNKHVGGREPRHRIPDLASESHASRQELVGKSLEVLSIGPVANESHMGLRTKRLQIGDRTKERELVLLRGQPAHADNDWP